MGDIVSDTSGYGSSRLDDTGSFNPRRRANARASARRASTGSFQVNRVAEEERFELTERLEHSSSARRDSSKSFHADSKTSVRRAAANPTSPTITGHPDLHTTHRPDRSAMGTPVPRGGSRRGADDLNRALPEVEDGTEDDAFEPEPDRTPRPYVRRERPRKTQAAIDDMEADDLYARVSYHHDSNITVGRMNPFSGTSRAYRRTQRSIPQLHEGHGYGRYLQVPKGRGSLFSMQVQRQRRRTAAAIIISILAIALLIFVIVRIVNG